MVLEQQKSAFRPENKNLEILALKAEYYRRNREFCTAKQLCKEILLQDNDHLFSLKVLARIFKQTKDTSKSRQVYSHILSLKPEDLKLLKEVAHFFLEQKEFLKAHKAFDLILKEDPFCKDALKEQKKLQGQKTNQKDFKEIHKLIQREHFPEAYQLLKKLERSDLSLELFSIKGQFLKAYKKFQKKKKIEQFIQRIEARSC